MIFKLTDMDSLRTDTDYHLFPLFREYLLELKQVRSGNFSYEMRHSIIFPSTHILQKSDHAFLCRITTKLAVDLQHFRFAHESTRRCDEMRRQKIIDLITMVNLL